MNLKEIKEMLQLMAEHDLREVEIEKDGMKVKFSKSGSVQTSVAASSATAQPVLQAPAAASQPAPSAQVAPPAPAVSDANIEIIKSPMVGTYYGAPSPDQPDYVTPGKAVKEGDVLCIVEAMKLMNEIKCEVSGQVVEVLVKNGQSVEFDQPLFKVKKG